MKDFGNPSEGNQNQVDYEESGSGPTSNANSSIWNWLGYVICWVIIIGLIIWLVIR